MNYYKNKLLRKSFCDSKCPLSIFDKKFEDMKRNYKKPPKRESLILYRDVVKACKKFFWKNKDGRECARREFEEHKNMEDSAEIGRKLVLGRQAIIEIEEKINKVHHEVNGFAQNTKNDRI